MVVQEIESDLQQDAFESEANDNISDNESEDDLENESENEFEDESENESANELANESEHESDERLNTSPVPEPFLILPFEFWLSIFFVGFTLVNSGLMLETMQKWLIFLEKPYLIDVILVIIGTKRSLAMTIGSRFSTQANLGLFSRSGDHRYWGTVVSNLTLVQCQSVIFGIFCAFLATQINGSFTSTLVLTGSSLVSSSVEFLVTGCMSAFVTAMSIRMNINPDNIIALIMAGFGDLVSLIQLVFISRLAAMYYSSILQQIWLVFYLLITYAIMSTFWLLMIQSNAFSYTMLYENCRATTVALSISVFGSSVANIIVPRLMPQVVYYSVFNGFSSILVAVQISRLSSALHAEFPVWSSVHRVLNEIRLLGPGKHSRTAWTLMAVVIPAQMLFFYLIQIAQVENNFVPPMFKVTYVCASLLHIFLIMHFSHTIVRWMWLNRIDPDNAAIPFMVIASTGLGNLLVNFAYLASWALY